MSSPIQLNAGDVFAKDFRVVRPLRSGGMGSVYVVHQLSTGAERALKLMHRELIADGRQRARFEQEAKVGSSIRSEHVVKVIVAGIDDETGLPYLVMELLEGEELENIIETRGAMPQGDVALVFSQLCHALAAAHAVGIVHRDLKPENIFIATAQRADVPMTVKILDFGIAKVIAEAKQSATQSLGTPLYMAPEQGDPRAKITPATDVWPLGLIAFVTLTGKVFWNAANVESGTMEMIMAEVLVFEIPAASDRAKELGVEHLLPPGFDEWFRSCTNRSPTARFATASDAWRSLAPLLGASSLGTTPHGPSDRISGSRFSNPQITGASTNPGGNTGNGTQIGGDFHPPVGGVGATVLASTGVQGAGQTGPARPKTKPWLYAAIGLAFLGAAGTWGYFLLRTQTPPKNKDDLGKVTYCGDIYYRNQVPECNSEITEAIQPHRSVSYRRTERDGHIALVERINGFGRLVDDENGFSSWEYTYGKEKMARSVVAKNHLGVIVRKDQINEDGTRTEMFDEFGEPRPIKDTHAVVLTSVFDDKGISLEDHYFNARGKPTMTKEKVYGYKSTRDPQGRPATTVGVDAKGTPMRTDQWMASVKRTYDKKGFEVGGQFQDENGIPILNKTGVSGYSAEVDDYGNIVLQKNLSADGRTIPTTQGYAIAKLELDDHGDIVKYSYLDATGKPTYLSNGTSSLSLKYDDHGNVIEAAAFDVEGKPTVVDVTGYWKAVSKFDERDLAVEQKFYGTDGQLVIRSGGFASVQTKYDARGNPIEQRYFGTDGVLIRCSDWTAVTKTTYDDHDHPTLILTLDPSEQPTLSSSGYAKETIKYDAHGNATQHDYFDVSGAPTSPNGGPSRIVRTFDELGDVASESFFDEQGKPVSGASYASMKATYDDNGVRTSVDYYGLDGHRVLSGEVSGERITTDNYGNYVTIDRIGVDGQPSTPVSRIKNDFDNRSLKVATLFSGPDGKPAGNDQKVSGFRKRYDERGNLVEERYLGVDGKSVMAGGDAGDNGVWDTYGRKLEETKTGSLDEPIKGAEGWAKQKLAYDPHGNVVDISYYGLSDERVMTSAGYSILRKQYDAWGRESAAFEFGIDEKPVVGGSGYHGYKISYDQRGNRQKIVYLDLDGNPTTKSLLIGENTFDDHDRQIRFRLLQADGTPGTNTNNVSETHSKYDDQGHLIEITFFGKDGKPTLDKNGVAAKRYRYDRKGRRLEEACLNIAGAPVDNTEGWSVQKMTYDDGGKLLKTELVNTGGMVVKTIDAAAK